MQGSPEMSVVLQHVIMFTCHPIVKNVRFLLQSFVSHGSNTPNPVSFPFLSVGKTISLYWMSFSLIYRLSDHFFTNISQSPSHIAS